MLGSGTEESMGLWQWYIYIIGVLLRFYWLGNGKQFRKRTLYICFHFMAKTGSSHRKFIYVFLLYLFVGIVNISHTSRFKIPYNEALLQFLFYFPVLL